MRWAFKYSEIFWEKVSDLHHDYHKKAVAQALKKIKALDHPKDAGGEYMNGWAYNVGEKSIIQCIIDENSGEVIFTNLVL